jgi:hypothetical protein
MNETVKKSALRMKGILLSIRIGTKENSAGIIIEKSSLEIKRGSHFSNGIVKINVRKKILPEIKAALYFPGSTTIFLRSKYLKVINEK